MKRRRAVDVDVELVQTGGQAIAQGAFLIADDGVYEVVRVEGLVLHCARVALEEIPADGDLYVWKWVAPRRPWWAEGST